MKTFTLFSMIFACYFIRIVVSHNHPLPYKTILNFGDSLSDTGNSVMHSPFPPNSPYGSTYFKHPAGRMSNGRLIIDFIAVAYGLPMLPAYLNLTKGQDVKKGVNFAYSGSTALDKHYFDKKGLDVKAALYSLNTQLKWFHKLKPSLCKNKKECDNCLKKSLILVGEIGGNDINAIIPRKNITEIREMVPRIVARITKITSKLIKEGAIHLAVPGNFPIGCNSYVLKTVKSDKKEDYDQFGCLRSYNAAIRYYNDQLKKALETLRQKYPHVKITYFDYYGAALRLFHAPQQYGFNFGKIETFRVCCGKGKGYHLDIPCGFGDATACPDPSKHINWDGFHFTETAYKLIAKGLIEGPFANPPLKSPLFKIRRN